MSEEDYGKLVMASMTHGTSHHHGDGDQGRPGHTAPEGHQHR
jgi:hypothetical protein